MSKFNRKVVLILTPYTDPHNFGSKILSTPNPFWARESYQIFHFLYFTIRTNLILLKKWGHFSYVFPVLVPMTHIQVVLQNYVYMYGGLSSKKKLLRPFFTKLWYKTIINSPPPKNSCPLPFLFSWPKHFLKWRAKRNF